MKCLHNKTKIKHKYKQRKNKKRRDAVFNNLRLVRLILDYAIHASTKQHENN